jgi:hypothetical protein
MRPKRAVCLAIGPGDCVGRGRALHRFYPESVLEPPGLSRSSLPEHAAFPVFLITSGAGGRNQGFRLAATRAGMTVRQLRWKIFADSPIPMRPSTRLSSGP